MNYQKGNKLLLKRQKQFVLIARTTILVNCGDKAVVWFLREFPDVQEPFAIFLRDAIIILSFVA
jgi:hypothetical protein